ncbi:MAG: hypothetical protein R6U41_12080 [Desulfosalsimonas sp.]|uniref:hypothetical protein n=1 Tax=Desulfosalsimonas sp. TaxID=3073848 RepID=UPI003970A813
MRNKKILCSIAMAGLMILLLAMGAAAAEKEKGKLYVNGWGFLSPAPLPENNH